MARPTKHIHCVWTDKQTASFNRPDRPLLPIMLHSVKEHCPDACVHLHYNGELPGETPTLAMIARKIGDEQQRELMAHKIKLLADTDWAEGDMVFVMDTDIIVLRDPFDVFDDDTFDVGITERQYEYPCPINAGVWCFRYNEASRRFLDFYAREVFEPSWVPFIKANVAGYGFNNRRAIGCDQNMLCAIHNNGYAVPFDCRIKNIGWQYNATSRCEDVTEISRKNALDVMGDKETRVFHFKGKWKNEMRRIGEEQGWI